MHPRFTAHPIGVLRASALSSPHNAPAWPDAPIDAPDHHDAWVAWLRQVRDHPVLGAAISDASPALFQRIDRICHGGAGGRDLARVARSCARYVLRAQSRAAPFGLFAGVAPARFTSAVSGTVGVDHRPVARVSTAWTTAAVERLESCEPEFTARLSVVVNTLAVVRGGRILVEHRPEPGAERGTCSSLRLTDPARVVLETARTPTPRAQVEAALNKAFPDRPEAVHDLVGSLVRHRVLLTCLHPPMDTPDPLGHLIATARGAGADRYPHAAAVLAHLKTAQRSLQEHDSAPEPAARATAMGRARTALADVAPAEAPTSVDLRLESDLDLPRTVAWQIQDAAGVLARLSPTRQGTPAWADYHRRFCERYGIGAVVPVAELTDPDRGLGLPAGFHGSRLPSPAGEVLSERDAVLLDLAQQATVDRADEVVVDEEVLDRLGATPPETVWPHTELRVRVHAKTRAALEAGDFRVVVAGASRSAGTTVGRFLDLLPSSGREALSELYRRLPTCARTRSWPSSPARPRPPAATRSPVPLRCCRPAWRWASTTRLAPTPWAWTASRSPPSLTACTWSPATGCGRWSRSCSTPSNSLTPPTPRCGSSPSCPGPTPRFPSPSRGELLPTCPICPGCGGANASWPPPDGDWTPTPFRAPTRRGRNGPTTSTGGAPPTGYRHGWTWVRTINASVWTWICPPTRTWYVPSWPRPGGCS